jgi:hypothetical protein
MAGRSGPAAVPPPWANTLPGFLDAYDLPAAVLDRGHGRPAYENDAFGALRSAHATLVQTLHAVVGAGKKRAGIVLDGRMVRWTVTHTSRTKEHGLRAVLLAHDMGDDEEGAEPTVSSTDLHTPALRLSRLTASSFPVCLCKSARVLAILSQRSSLDGGCPLRRALQHWGRDG